jgi:hypothetical protein
LVQDEKKRKEKKKAINENYLENRISLALASRRRFIPSRGIATGEASGLWATILAECSPHKRFLSGEYEPV